MGGSLHPDRLSELPSAIQGEKEERSPRRLESAACRAEHDPLVHESGANQRLCQDLAPYVRGVEGLYNTAPRSIIAAIEK